MSSDDDASASAAPGAADADAPSMLSEAQRNEIVDAVKQMVKAGKRYSAVLHGWDLKYNLRKTGTAVRGDMCAIDPRDGQKIFSQIALKRKLQVAVEPSAAPEAGEKRPRARRGFEEYKVDENLERGARRRTVVNYAEKSGASGDRGVPLVSGNLVVRVIEAAELNGDAEKDGVPALDMPAITERMEVSGEERPYPAVRHALRGLLRSGRVRRRLVGISDEPPLAAEDEPARPPTTTTRRPPRTPPRPPPTSRRPPSRPAPTRSRRRGRRRPPSRDRRGRNANRARRPPPLPLLLRRRWGVPSAAGAQWAANRAATALPACRRRRACGRPPPKPPPPSPSRRRTARRRRSSPRLSSVSCSRACRSRSLRRRRGI